MTSVCVVHVYIVTSACLGLVYIVINACLGQVYIVTRASRVSRTDFGMGGTCPPIGGNTWGDKSPMGELARDSRQNLEVSQISK